MLHSVQKLNWNRALGLFLNWTFSEKRKLKEEGEMSGVKASVCHSGEVLLGGATDLD